MCQKSKIFGSAGAVVWLFAHKSVFRLIICMQSEEMWYHFEMESKKNVSEHFPSG